MTNEELTTFLSVKFPEAEFRQGSQYLEMIVTNSTLHMVATFLKETRELAFDYLMCLSGVDFPEFLTVVYHLESTSNKHCMVLKAKTENREKPVLDTVCDIWPTAEFHEREVFDLLGVKFNYHPDLRRLFLGDEWGFPLRKDYVDDVHIVER